MYTIKQASRLTGVPAATLRAWEHRYGAVQPTRSPSGYRLYDKADIAAVIGMRRLVDSGWAPAEAARAIREGTVDAGAVGTGEPIGSSQATDAHSSGSDALRDFLTAAARLDSLALDESLDRGFASGSFEFTAENWLFPALIALGEGWACGDIDVAGEHLASQAVQRRLASAFEAAGWRSRGPLLLVGLPPGSQHELGALAFAVSAKRRGLNVTYLGADLPKASWVAAAAAPHVDAAVLAVVMAEDRGPAAEVAQALQASRPELLVAAGGAHSADLAEGVLTLPTSLGGGAEEIDHRLHRVSG